MSLFQPKKHELQYEEFEDNAESNDQIGTKYGAHAKRNDQICKSPCLRQGSFVRRSFAHDVVQTSSKFSPVLPTIVINESKEIKRNVQCLKDIKMDLLTKGTKVAETAIKVGAEFVNSSDPFEAAAKVCGKTSAGASLSRFSASQCAGLIGVIVASFTPQVSELYKLSGNALYVYLRLRCRCYSKRLMRIWSILRSPWIKCERTLNIWQLSFCHQLFKNLIVDNPTR